MKPKPRFIPEEECRRLRVVRETLRKIDAALKEFRRGIERELAKEVGEEEARRIMGPRTEL